MNALRFLPAFVVLTTSSCSLFSPAEKKQDEGNAGYRYDVARREIPAGRPFPLKLDTPTLRMVSEIEGFGGAPLGEEFALRFREEGDYLLLTLEVSQTEPPKLTELSTMAGTSATYTVDVTARVIAADGTGEVMADASSPGQCTVNTNAMATFIGFDPDDVYQEQRHRAFSHALASVLDKLERQRTELQQAHTRQLMNQPF